MIDFYFGVCGQRCGARCIVHPLRCLLEIHGIRIANPDVGDRLVRHDVRRCATLGDDALDPCFWAQIASDAIDVVEQLDDGFERIAAVPGEQLMRRRA